MDKAHQDILRRIMELMETGCEAVEHLTKLKSNPLEVSFSLATDTMEMLSAIQESLEVFQEEKWWTDISHSLQSLITLFGQLANSYEAEDKDAYHITIDSIYLQYMAFHSEFVDQVTIAEQGDVVDECCSLSKD